MSAPTSGMDSSEEQQVTYVAFQPKRFRRGVLVVFVALIAYRFLDWTWGRLGSFLFLILLSWLIAISFDPIISWLATKGLRRGVATAIVGALLLVLLAVFIAIFGNVLIQQSADLLVALPAAVLQAVAWLNGNFHTNLDPATIVENLNLTPSQIGSMASSFGGGLLGVLTGTVVLVFDFVTILVFSFYFAADAPRIKRWIASWLKPAQQLVFIDVWEISVQKAGGFVISKLALASISAIFHSAFFYFIDLPYWLPMGIFAGVTAQFIPSIGTYIGVAVPAFFAAFTSPIDILWIILFATVFQQAENYVLTPRISNKTMDINSGVALGSVFIGAALFGPIGALIGIPLAAIIIAVVETYGHRHDLHPDVAEKIGGSPPTDIAQ